LKVGEEVTHKKALLAAEEGRSAVTCIGDERNGKRFQGFGEAGRAG
jgi:hypothetical protein